MKRILFAIVLLLSVLSFIGILEARWYDPVTGKFISRDPMGEDVDTNLYRYVANNPVNWVDPLGLMSPEQWIKAKSRIDQIEKAKPSYGSGPGQYVCNKFVISAYGAAGIDLSGRANDIYAKSKSSGNFFTNTGKLKSGDLIYFDYNGDGNVDHVGIYDGLDAKNNILFSHMSRSGLKKSDCACSFDGHGRQKYGQAIIGFSSHD